MSSTSILLLWDRIGDYHLARIKACKEHASAEVYSADLGAADNLYKWDNVLENNHVVLSDKPIHEKDFWNRFSNFRKIIKSKKIDVIALGYGRLEYLVFMIYARIFGIKTIVFCESWYSRGKIKDFFKSLLLKFIGDYYFVSGERAFAHFVHNYKIDSSLVYKGYSVVDNDHFVSSVENEKKYIICVARYSEEKNLEFLIRCFSQSTIRSRYRLLLVGDGPLKKQLQQLIADLNLNTEVELSGWKKYNELPVIYGQAICCILPSTFEPWGLVVNEAMAAGLPIFVSDACGCKPDLLDEGKNGWSFNENDEKDLIGKLDLFIELSDEQKKGFKNHSFEKVKNFSKNTWADTIQKILDDIKAKKI